MIQLYSIPLYERYSFMRQKFFYFNNLLLFEYKENEFGMQLLKFLYGATIPLHILNPYQLEQIKPYTYYSRLTYLTDKVLFSYFL